MPTRVREPLSVLLSDESAEAVRVSYPASLQHSESGIASVFIGALAWASLAWGFVELAIERNQPASDMLWFIGDFGLSSYEVLFFLGFTCAIIGLATGVVGECRSAGKKKITCHIGVLVNLAALAVSILAIEVCAQNT
ncbi:MAG: hypothetical protein LLG01_03215 [Planctomycetaceae bacterium]|nr:hypothetical protein [Planctomycetaceae bacterium]